MFVVSIGSSVFQYENTVLPIERILMICKSYTNIQGKTLQVVFGECIISIILLRLLNILLTETFLTSSPSSCCCLFKRTT